MLLDEDTKTRDEKENVWGETSSVVGGVRELLKRNLGEVVLCDYGSGRGRITSLQQNSLSKRNKRYKSRELSYARRGKEQNK